MYEMENVMRCGFKRTTIWLDEDETKYVDRIETWQCSRTGIHKFNDADGDGEMMLCTQHLKIAQASEQRNKA